MNTHAHMLPYSPCNSFFFFFYLFLLTKTLPQSVSQKDDKKYIACSRTYNCGNLVISYPFWGGNRSHYCGRDGFEVSCLSPDIASIQIGSHDFTLTDFNYSRFIVKMVRTDIPNYDNCSFHFTNTSQDSTLFSFDPTVVNMTLFYDRDPGFSIGQNNITCRDNGGNRLPFWINLYGLNSQNLFITAGFNFKCQLHGVSLWTHLVELNR